MARNYFVFVFGDVGGLPPISRERWRSATGHSNAQENTVDQRRVSSMITSVIDEHSMKDFAWFNHVRHEFQMLHSNVPAGYNWSNETKVHALTRLYKNYYSVKNSAIITDNANNEPLPPLPCQHLVIEGLPGTGKTFVILTLRNDNVILTETFEGVIRTEAQTESAAANANLLATAVGAVVRNARNGSGNAHPPNPPNNHNVNVYANANVNLPQPQFDGNQTTATFQHNQVLRVDGFADMNRTPYAWARAFPSLFIPVYIVKNHVNNEYGWVIFHDITGWSGPCDKIVNRVQWYEHMMWRSDGNRPAPHPTFGLILYNHKVKKSLLAGFSGLEHFSGTYIAERYCTGYQCKGNKNK